MAGARAEAAEDLKEFDNNASSGWASDRDKGTDSAAMSESDQEARLVHMIMPVLFVPVLSLYPFYLQPFYLHPFYLYLFYFDLLYLHPFYYTRSIYTGSIYIRSIYIRSIYIMISGRKD
jgi:hypothetical protein